jgi:tetratricopeptide (TPR) repeat protein
MFGRAVLAARRRIYEEYPAVNSWGAYQCYGDPDYTLVPREGLIETESRVGTYHAVAEVISDLENLAGDAYAAAPEAIGGLKTRVRAIEERLPAPWLGMAAVRSALGRAYGQLDDFAAAIGHYQAALSADPAELSVKAVEQLANLQIRWGASLAGDSGKGGTAAAAEAIRDGRRRLELLLQLGITGERLSLMGSACKRLAMLAEGAERDEALAAMIDYYRQAHELARQKTGAVDPYPLLNWLVGLHLADLRKKSRKARAPLGTWLKEVEQIADERDDREPDFWNGIVRTECLLTRHLAAGDLAAHREAVAEGYLRVFRRGATPKELRSVIEHVDFIIALLDGEAQTETRHALLELRDKLKLSLS